MYLTKRVLCFGYKLSKSEIYVLAQVSLSAEGFSLNLIASFFDREIWRTYMKIVLTFLLLLLPIGSFAEYYPAPEYLVYGRPAIQNDKTAVDKLISSFREAWSSQDAKTIAELHSSDANWTNAFGRVFRGSENLELFLSNNLFPNYPAAVSTEEMENFKSISRRYIGADTIIIHAYTSSKRGSALSGGERRIYFDFVVAKLNDDWKIVHQTISDIREIRN